MIQVAYPPTSGPNQNEFYWPVLKPPSETPDLDAWTHWWRKVATPTGGVILTTATAEAIAATYGDELLKCVAAASGDGLKTTWTYANEKRIKLGKYIATRVAVYIVTAGRALTCSLLTSVPTILTSKSITTTGSWQIVNLSSGSTTIDGTTVTFQGILDGAGTFYVIPLGTHVSAVSGLVPATLQYRGIIDRWKDTPTAVKVLTGLSDENTWTDISCQVGSSALAVEGLIESNLNEAASGFDLFIRAKGSAGGGIIVATTGAGGIYTRNGIPVVFDDTQRIQYNLDRFGTANTLDFGEMYLQKYREWA